MKSLIKKSVEELTIIQLKKVADKYSIHIPSTWGRSKIVKRIKNFIQPYTKIQVADIFNDIHVIES